MILNGEIVGFVEVKPGPDSRLKVAQLAFRRMCERCGVPFVRWDPTEPLPQFIQKARLFQGRNRGAD